MTNTYRSCHSIEGELFFNHLNKVGYCCMLTPNGGQPILYENYQGELIDWDKFFKQRDEHIELMKRGLSLPACKDCLWIKDAKWEVRKKEFRYILFNIWVKCNLYCIYCSNHKDENVLNNTKEYNLIPVIKDMIEKKVLTENTKIDIAGGEATLDKNFDEFLSLLIDSGVKNININTNSTIFSKSIEDGIKKGVVSIISSVDSGTPKKFAYIKKKKLWNNVWQNISKYSKSINQNINNNSVRTKFIIIPGINSSKSEILKFILKSKKSNVSGVILNIDLHWLRQHYDDKNTMTEIINLTKYFIRIANILDIDWQIWAHIEDLIKRYNLVQESSKIDINFIFDKTKKRKTINDILFISFLKILSLAM